MTPVALQELRKIADYVKNNPENIDTLSNFKATLDTILTKKHSYAKDIFEKPGLSAKEQEIRSLYKEIIAHTQKEPKPSPGLDPRMTQKTPIEHKLSQNPQFEGQSTTDPTLKAEGLTNSLGQPLQKSRQFTGVQLEPYTPLTDTLNRAKSYTRKKSAGRTPLIDRLFKSPQLEASKLKSCLQLAPFIGTIFIKDVPTKISAILDTEFSAEDKAILIVQLFNQIDPKDMTKTIQLLTRAQDEDFNILEMAKMAQRQFDAREPQVGESYFRS